MVNAGFNARGGMFVVFWSGEEGGGVDMCILRVRGGGRRSVDMVRWMQL